MAAEDVPEKRMSAYMQLFHTVLLQEARKNPDDIHKGNVDSGPLTEKRISILRLGRRRNLINRRRQ